MRPRSDAARTSHEDDDEEALRRFLAYRDAADGDGARAAATELLELVHDRIDGQVAVAAWRTGVPLDERDDVVQAVHLGVMEAVRGLRRGSVGELRSLIRTEAHRRCVEHVRVRGRGELDAQPLQHEIEAAWEQHARPEQPIDVEAFLEWAMPQLERRQRMVLQRDRDGVDPEAISVALRVTRANLDQLRGEANVALQALRREWAS